MSSFEVDYKIAWHTEAFDVWLDKISSPECMTFAADIINWLKGNVSILRLSAYWHNWIWLLSSPTLLKHLIMRPL